MSRDFSALFLFKMIQKLYHLSEIMQRVFIMRSYGDQLRTKKKGLCSYERIKLNNQRINKLEN